MSDNPCDTIYNGSDSRRPADRARKSLTTISNYLIAGCCAGALYLGLTDGPMPVDLRPENWYHSENSQTNENRISLRDIPNTGIISPDRRVSLNRDPDDRRQLILSRTGTPKKQNRIMLAPKDPIRARWINSHDILIHAREGDLSELILASTDWQKPIRRLQPEEEMVSAAPNGKAYLTRQLNRIESKMTPEVKVSWTVTFQDLEGKTINSTVIPATLIQSAASPDGTIIIDAMSADIRKGMGPNPVIERQGIYLFRPPNYQLEMIIKDASYFTMTERGRLAFLQYKDKTSRIPSTLEEMEFPSMQRRTIALPGEPYHQHNRRQASLALLLWTISMMGIYGVAIERHRRETNPLDTALPPKAAATCAAMIGAQTTGLFTAAIYAEQFMTTYNTGLPPTIQTRAMQAGTLLAMTIIANSLYSLSNRLKAPKIGSFLRLINYMRHGKPADWKSQTESYNSTYLEVGPIENEIMLSKEDILNGNYESARIHSYNAVERCGMASILPEYSFFHALISKINESIDEAQARLDSQGANPQKRSAILECRQAYRLSKGLIQEAEGMTDEILSLAGEGNDGARLHQARVHTAIGSERAKELWRSPLERIIATTSPESFTQVQGGTSEVVKVSRERNPYAEKAVILKRSRDHKSLYKEYLITSEISHAVGGINGMSSLPLTFIDPESNRGAQHARGYSYLAMLFIDGPTLQECARTMSKKETERYMRDEALPMIARYHALLQKNIEAGGTTLNRMDYDSIFNSKFARRVTDDPKEQEELMIAGQPLNSHLSSLGRSPIHGDLHTGNIITPKMILIDPADASYAHDSLDISHLLHDPSLRQDPSSAVILFDHYRRLRGHDTQSYRAQDAAGTVHRLCHLVGRDVAYNRPEELRPHAMALLWSTLALAEMGIPGIDRACLRPIEAVARKMAG